MMIVMVFIVAQKIHKILSEKFDVSIKRGQKIMGELRLKLVIVKKFKLHSTKIKIGDKDSSVASS